MSNEIDHEVLKLLKDCPREVNKVSLPESVRVPSEVKDGVIKVMASIGGQWKVSLRSFDFDSDPSPALDEVLTTGMLPIVKLLSYYDTPPRLVARMLDMIPQTSKRVLEPSAGEGVIAKAVLERFPQASINAMEINMGRSGILKRMSKAWSIKGFSRLTALQGDFLGLRQTKGYDCVLMHPPFITDRNKLEWIDHFRHAFGMLIEGGMLVGVAPAGLLYSGDPKINALKESVIHNKGSIELLSPKMFKVDDQYVPTALVQMTRGV